MVDVKQMVEDKIAGKKVMVFSKTYCPYCVMAKKAFEPHLGEDIDQEDYEVWDMEKDPNCQAIQDYLLQRTKGRTKDPNCQAIQDYLLQKTKGRTVPRVFIGGECIGGGTETKAMHASGALKQKLLALK